MKITVLSVLQDQALTVEEQALYDSGRVLDASWDTGRVWLLIAVPHDTPDTEDVARGEGEL